MVLLSCRTQALCSREDDGVWRVTRTTPASTHPEAGHITLRLVLLCACGLFVGRQGGRRLRALPRPAHGQAVSLSGLPPGNLPSFPGAAFPLASVGTVSWLAAACGRAVVSCATKKPMSLTCFLLMMIGSAAGQSPTRCDQWGLFGLPEATWCCSWPAAGKAARRGGWWGAGWPTRAGGT